MNKVDFYQVLSWEHAFAERGAWVKPAEGVITFITPVNWNGDYFIKSIPNSRIIRLDELLAGFIRRSKQKHLISRPMMEIILSQIILNSEFNFLDIETYHHGYAKALTEFISDFRNSCNSSLVTALNTHKKSAVTKRDLNVIAVHDEYEKIIDRIGYDQRSAVLALSETLTAENVQMLLELTPDSRIVFIGFAYLKPLELIFLNALFKVFTHITWVYCQNQQAAEIIFRVQEPLKSFITEVKKAENHRYIDYPHHKPLFYHLAEALFQEKIRTAHPELLGATRIFQANNRYQEVIGIARSILELVKYGIFFDDIQIVTPQYPIYAAIFNEVFPRYGIPFHLSEGRSLISFPLTQTVIAVLQYGAGKNSFNIREKLFTSPFITYQAKIAPEALREYAGTIRPDLFEQHELDQFIDTEKTITLDAGSLFQLQNHVYRTTVNAGNYSPAELVIADIERRYTDNRPLVNRKVYEVVVQYFLLNQAEKELFGWKSRMLPEIFYKQAIHLFKRFQLRESIGKFQNEFADNEKFRAVFEQNQAIFAQIERILLKLKDDFNSLAGDQNGYTLLDYLRCFTALVDESDYALKERTPQGVTVYSLKADFIRKYPVTFICGMIDGEFPEKEPFNFFNPKIDGISLTGDFTAVDHARYLLYQIITSTGRTLYLSYPANDNGKNLQVSPFIREIQKELTGNSRLESADKTALYSINERVIYASAILDRNYSDALPVLKTLKQEKPDYLAHLLRIYRTDTLRNQIRFISGYDGIISSKPALELIAARMKRIDWGYETLNRFAGCPFRFLYDDLMVLRPDYLTDYHPDRTVKGIMLRKILDFYTQTVCRNNGTVTREQVQETAQYCRQLLAETDQDKLDLFNRKIFDTISQGLEDPDNPGRPGIILSFINHENQSVDLLDLYQAEQPVEILLKSIRIRLTLDRIDRSRTGQYLIIYRYTTGEPILIDKILHGLEFELPLLIIALTRKLAAEHSTLQVGGAGYYQVKTSRSIKKGPYFGLKELQASRTANISPETPVFSGQRSGFYPSAIFHSLLEKIEERALQIEALIYKGRFHLPLCSERFLSCTNCHFCRICFRDGLRQDRLARLLNDPDLYKADNLLLEGNHYE